MNTFDQATALAPPADLRPDEVRRIVEGVKARQRQRFAETPDPPTKEDAYAAFARAVARQNEVERSIDRVTQRKKKADAELARVLELRREAEADVARTWVKARPFDPDAAPGDILFPGLSRYARGGADGE